MIWLDTWNFVIKRLCQKLKNCCASPYLIRQIISTYIIELELFENICMHPIFHVNLLKSTATDSLHVDHIQPSPLSVEVDSETKWEVETIVDL